MEDDVKQFISQVFGKWCVQEVTIVDTKGLSTMEVMSKKNDLKDILHFASLIKVEANYKTFIVNAGWGFRAIWSLVKSLPFVTEKTAAKTKILGKPSIKVYKGLIDREHLPEQHCGICPIPIEKHGLVMPPHLDIIKQSEWCHDYTPFWEDCMNPDYSLKPPTRKTKRYFQNFIAPGENSPTAAAMYYKQSVTDKEKEYLQVRQRKVLENSTIMSSLSVHHSEMFRTATFSGSLNQDVDDEDRTKSLKSMKKAVRLPESETNSDDSDSSTSTESSTGFLDKLCCCC